MQMSYEGGVLNLLSQHGLAQLETFCALLKRRFSRRAMATTICRCVWRMLDGGVCCELLSGQDPSPIRIRAVRSQRCTDPAKPTLRCEGAVSRWGASLPRAASPDRPGARPDYVPRWPRACCRRAGLRPPEDRRRG